MKILLTPLCLICLSTSAFAATINFKDGHSVMASIMEKTASQVKVDLNGITMTYYADEIKDIDGVALETPKAVKISATKLAIPAVQKENPADKKALILKFIDVFGTRKAMERNFQVLMDNLAQQKPEEAQKIKDGFKIDEIIDRLVPLYDKYFTTEDLKAYIDFYSSDKGQKLITSIGSVMKDSIQVGTDYLKEKFPELDNK